MQKSTVEYSIHSNGWTVFVDEDINSLSCEQAQEVGRLAATNLVVVFRNQNLTPETQVRFCSDIGDCQLMYNPNKPLAGQRTEHIAVNPYILRVTGEKSGDGVSKGIAGHSSALDWHADQPSKKDRSPLLWLYAVNGVSGSRTSWINLAKVYNELPDKLISQIKDKKIVCGYKDNTYTSNPFFKEHIAKDTPFSLVTTNKSGLTGLYFPFHQIFEMVDTGDEEFGLLMNELKRYTLQERFTYHHDWQAGDVVISEQWLSIHKRWEFKGMENRMLHRIAFNYSNL